ncbi:hypothetical protein Syn6312_2874 [Synechococcus sp. PCC 6312]|nr:hypothetical protein Syn6312_2874 [Synechococcus sp. PCC 6312]
MNKHYPVFKSVQMLHLRDDHFSQINSFFRGFGVLTNKEIIIMIMHALAYQ